MQTFLYLPNSVSFNIIDFINSHIWFLQIKFAFQVTLASKDAVSINYKKKKKKTTNNPLKLLYNRFNDTFE